MTSQEQAAALLQLDDLYDQAHTFRAWLGQSSASDGSYESVKALLEQANPGLVVKRLNMTYRMGHVLAPKEDV